MTGVQSTRVSFALVVRPGRRVPDFEIKRWYLLKLCLPLGERGYIDRHLVHPPSWLLKVSDELVSDRVIKSPWLVPWSHGGRWLSLQEHSSFESAVSERLLFSSLLTSI